MGPEEAWTAKNSGWNVRISCFFIPQAVQKVLIHTLTAGKHTRCNPRWRLLEQPKGRSFDDINKTKFKSVCIPVTWTEHFASQAPNCTHLPSSQFPLLLTSLYRLDGLNRHHDSWQWTDFTIDPGTLLEHMNKFEILWIQIPNRRSLQEQIWEANSQTPQWVARKKMPRSITLRIKSLWIMWGTVGVIIRIGCWQARVEYEYSDDSWFVEGAGQRRKLYPWLWSLGFWLMSFPSGMVYPQLNTRLTISINSTSWGRIFLGYRRRQEGNWRYFHCSSNCFKAPALVNGVSLANPLNLTSSSAQQSNTSSQPNYGITAMTTLVVSTLERVDLAILQNAVKGINNSIVSYGQEAVLYFAPEQTVGERSINLDWNGIYWRMLDLNLRRVLREWHSVQHTCRQ